MGVLCVWIYGLRVCVCVNACNQHPKLQPHTTHHTTPPTPTHNTTHTQARLLVEGGHHLDLLALAQKYPQSELLAERVMALVEALASHPSLVPTLIADGTLDAVGLIPQNTKKKKKIPNQPKPFHTHTQTPTPHTQHTHTQHWL